jgi:GDP-4-dehydro-6-deoxy-D-mannose reductase
VKVLITGRSGFVGQHFSSRYGGVSFASASDAVDLRDPVSVRSAVASVSPDAVLHLAAQSSVASSFDNPTKTFDVNFFGTLHLLQALSEIGFNGVFVYVGSADVYGATDEAQLPVNEAQPLRPRSPYAVSKIAAEALCYQWSQTHSFKVVLTRPFNQIGPGQNLQFAVPDFARQVVNIRRGQQAPILVTGNLDVTRDFTDVRDVVHAYHMLLTKGRNGEIYNICSGRERSLRSIVDALLRIAGVEAEIQVDADRLRPSEQRRMVGDSRKIRDLIGWEPEIDLETTLTDILRKVEEEE